MAALAAASGGVASGAWVVSLGAADATGAELAEADAAGSARAVPEAPVAVTALGEADSLAEAEAAGCLPCFDFFFVFAAASSPIDEIHTTEATATPWSKSKRWARRMPPKYRAPLRAAKRAKRPKGEYHRTMALRSVWGRRAMVCGASLLLACSGGSGVDLDGSPGDDGGTDGPIAPTPDGSTGTDAAPNDGSTAPDTGTVTPPGPAYGAKCTNPDANETKATDEVAIVRGKAKLPPMNCVDSAMKAANNHSSYIALNGWTLTHTETQGNPGFTGVNFWNRLTYAGYTGSPSFEVVHSVADAHEAITGQNGWINTLYHRIPFVAYGTKDFGFGYASSTGGQDSTTDFGSGNSASKTAMTTWPADGDTAVWTTFHNAYESPNPLPNQQVAGYPITVVGGSALTLATHDVTANSGAVNHIVMTSGNDPAGLIPSSQVYLIPNSVLAKNTKYTVHVTGTVNGQAYDRTFSFTTGSI